jgi:transposase
VEASDGQQYVGIDLHKWRSVIVRMTRDGERIGRPVRIDSEPFELAAQIASWGEAAEVVLEATYGWYWAADLLTDAGVSLHLAHPLGVKGFAYRRVKNDERDASDLADLVRMGRLPEAWIALRRYGACGRRCGTGRSWSRCVRGSRRRCTRCSIPIPSSKQLTATLTATATHAGAHQRTAKSCRHRV